MRATRFALPALAAAMLTACGGGSTVVRTVTAAAPTTAVSTPAAASPTEPASQSAPAPAPVTTAQSSVAEAPVASIYVMPNEVGKVLQAAQDDMQVVTNNPLFYTSSSDATGAGRSQIIDSGWQVCSQIIAPGSQFTDDDAIDFAVVRLSETCP